jgi:hypothetical protein
VINNAWSHLKKYQLMAFEPCLFKEWQCEGGKNETEGRDQSSNVRIGSRYQKEEHQGKDVCTDSDYNAPGKTSLPSLIPFDTPVSFFDVFDILHKSCAHGKKDAEKD